MKTILWYSILYFCFVSCYNSATKALNNENPLSEPYHIAVDLDGMPVEETLMLSDVIDSLEYIKLEYNKKYPVGFIIDGFLPYITKDYIFFMHLMKRACCNIRGQENLCVK